MKKNYLDKFNWNKEYIITHTLDEDIIKRAGIKKLDDSEVFVQHPKYKDYYCSQYGRAISIKGDRVKLLGANIGGQPDRQYLYYTFSMHGYPTTIGAHRAVADIFCPNFWKSGRKKIKFEAHHIDGNKMNNNYRNIILLPTHLHAAIHKIKKMVLFKDGQIIEYKNPLDMVYDTGLKLEDILLANKGKKKPLKSQGGYTVFNVKGHLIGFKYYPETRRKK